MTQARLLFRENRRTCSLFKIDKTLLTRLEGNLEAVVIKLDQTKSRENTTEKKKKEDGIITAE